MGPIFKSNNIFLLLVLLSSTTYIFGQQAIQTQSNSYTRYELLSPESNQFRILYDVSATTAGKKYYFNTLRLGSEHKINGVLDLMTGLPLKWEVVSGIDAKNQGHPMASEKAEYLKVHLARGVPENGEARIRIDKTYKDPNSYYSENDKIVFDRSLGIKRNAVVLPKGYEVVTCNYPSQVELEHGERIKLSFINRGSSSVGYRIEARKLSASSLKYKNPGNPNPWEAYSPRAQGRDKSKARIGYNLNERAFQNRDIVYFLQQPETHSFRLYHDYTEKREGQDKYINIVRVGSKASNPSAYILDTGEKLAVETLKGSQITEKNIDIGQETNEDTEVVVIWYPKVKKGQSLRLRIEETYTDPNRYLLHNDELIWDRSFGRNRNTIILPEGWWLTTNSIPAIINQQDGQPSLYFVNDRPDNIDVLIRARRR